MSYPIRKTAPATNRPKVSSHTRTPAKDLPKTRSNSKPKPRQYGETRQEETGRTTGERLAESLRDETRRIIREQGEAAGTEKLTGRAEVAVPRIALTGGRKPSPHRRREDAELGAVFGDGAAGDADALLEQADRRCGGRSAARLLRFPFDQLLDHVFVLSDGVKKSLNGITLRDGSITYLLAVARLTVDSCTPTCWATTARVSGRNSRTPPRRKSLLQIADAAGDLLAAFPAAAGCWR